MEWSRRAGESSESGDADSRNGERHGCAPEGRKNEPNSRPTGEVMMATLIRVSHAIRITAAIVHWNMRRVGWWRYFRIQVIVQKFVGIIKFLSIDHNSSTFHDGWEASGYRMSRIMVWMLRWMELHQMLDKRSSMIECRGTTGLGARVRFGIGVHECVGFQRIGPSKPLIASLIGA
jgi:hypothetical protein